MNEHQSTPVIDDPPERTSGGLNRKYVALHVVGDMPRGTIFTPLDLYGEMLTHKRPANVGKRMRTGPGTAPAVLHYRYLTDDEIMEMIDRLVGLKAAREANHFESTQTFVTLPDEAPTMIANEQKIQEMQAEMDKMRAKVAQMEAERGLGAARAASSQVSQAPAHVTPALISQKDAEINSLRQEIAALKSRGNPEMPRAEESIPPASAEEAAPKHKPLAPSPPPGSKPAPRGRSHE